MSVEVRGALSEWAAGLLLSAIPLLAHGLVAIGMKDAGAGAVQPDFTVDFLFGALASAAAGPFSACTRLLNGALNIDKLGKRALVLIAGGLLFMMGAAVMYGLTAAGVASDSMWIMASGIYLGAVICSLFLELTIAAALAR